MIDRINAVLFFLFFTSLLPVAFIVAVWRGTKAGCGEAWHDFTLSLGSVAREWNIMLERLRGRA